MTTPYYEDDAVAIYLGDCVEVLPSLPPVDLVVTDPPYAFGRRQKEWQVTPAIGAGLSVAATKVAPRGAMIVMAAASGRGIEHVQRAVGGILPLNRLLVWHKSFVNSPVAGPWRWDIVPVLVFGRGSFGRPQFSSCYISDGQFRGEDGGHPSPLPAGVGTWLVRPFTDAQTVLDPFCGTGVILAAARAAGKKAIGIDADERACEAAAGRLGQGLLPLTEAAG